MAAALLFGRITRVTMADEETNFDPFEVEETTNEEDTEVETDLEETETNDEAEGETEDESTDEADDESEDVESTDETEEDETSTNEKMIPESRFKAAIKDLQSKLDATLQENAKYKATPAPDRDADPEGYEAHLRLETSKTLMREFKEDYVEVITHFQEMAKINPQLNEIVAKHELPAKLAYDLAKRDLEIRELTEARNSDEWKEFQEFKKNKGKSTVADDLASPTNKAAKLPRNLNRATSSKPKTVSPSDDDYLFADSPLDRT
jgi:hypothetical protein